MRSSACSGRRRGSATTSSRSTASGRSTGLSSSPSRPSGRCWDLAPDLQPTGASVVGHQVGFASPGGEPVLVGLNLEIPAGQTVAVVGATGSGKSPLAMLLVRLWDPVTGVVSLDGRDLRRFARAEL